MLGMRLPAYVPDAPTAARQSLIRRVCPKSQARENARVPLLPNCRASILSEPAGAIQVHLGTSVDREHPAGRDFSLLFTDLFA
jgi:hypothetical protein